MSSFLPDSATAHVCAQAGRGPQLAMQILMMLCYCSIQLKEIQWKSSTQASASSHMVNLPRVVQNIADLQACGTTYILAFNVITRLDVRMQLGRTHVSRREGGCRVERRTKGV